jgi:hypothetical protein
MPSRARTDPNATGDENAEDEDEVERQEALQGDRHRQGCRGTGRQAARDDQADEQVHPHGTRDPGAVEPDQKIVKSYMPYDR